MWRRYLRFWGSDVRADVDAELDYHLRELTERLVHEGRGPAEARAEAERRFGDYARVEEACVDIDRGWERQQRWRQMVADLWNGSHPVRRTGDQGRGPAVARDPRLPAGADRVRADAARFSRRRRHRPGRRRDGGRPRGSRRRRNVGAVSDAAALNPAGNRELSTTQLRAHTSSQSRSSPATARSARHRSAATGAPVPLNRIVPSSSASR